LDQADSSRRPHRPQVISPDSRYRRTACPAGPRGAAASWAAMKSASLTSAGCSGCFEMTQPSGRFHRWTCLCPSAVLAGSTAVHIPRHRETGAREPPSSRRGRCIYRAGCDVVRQEGARDGDRRSALTGAGRGWRGVPGGRAASHRSCRSRATRPSGCSRFLTPSSRVPSTGHPPQKSHAREGVTRGSDRPTVRGTANEPARRTDGCGPAVATAILAVTDF